jgi:hypothetical protein
VLLVAFIFIYNNKNKISVKINSGFLSSIIKIIFSSFIMLGSGIALHYFIFFTKIEKLNAVLSIAVTGGIISIIYLLACLVFKVPEMRYIWGKIRKYSGI